MTVEIKEKELDDDGKTTPRMIPSKFIKKRLTMG